MSSISGSESDSGEEDSESEGGVTRSNVTSTDNESSAESSVVSGRLSSKVVFQNSAGQYLSVYRCILQGKVSRCTAVQGVNCKRSFIFLVSFRALFLLYFSQMMSKMLDPP